MARRKDEKAPHEKTNLRPAKNRRNNARRKVEITKRRQAERRKIRVLRFYNFNMCYRTYLNLTVINGIGMPDANIMH